MKKFNIDVCHLPPTDRPPFMKKPVRMSDEDWVRHAYSTLPQMFALRRPEGLEGLVVHYEQLSTGVRFTLEGNLSEDQFKALARRVIDEQNEITGAHLGYASDQPPCPTP